MTANDMMTLRALLEKWPAPILCTSSYVSPGTVFGKG